MKVIIDEDKCVGAGQCVLAAPDVFDQRDEDGIVVLLDALPPDALRSQVENAAALCPALAIEVVK
ncbi:ferredoxin [Streptomyces sioyaensis]|uniref:Ferredoxin n=1 Tax=Streptomyces sioyaensis TaxID=67364 RepID=A0A4Q1QTS2_9ACTN|nr:ferredoxin [Streptomyces sioyaensis]MBM4791304.1 ferredoxin [Streptomyces sioyaensis]RXS65176.1 ferredoxin [Streptomyces sioyaensis]